MNDFFTHTVNHSFKNQKEIGKIASLLEKYFNINYFYYTEITRDGKYNYFSSKIDWCEHLFKHAEELDFFTNLKPCNFPVSVNVRKDESINHTSKKFDIHYLFEFVTHKKDHSEFFGFATKPSETFLLNSFVSQIPLLTLFIQQTKRKHNLLFDTVKNNYVDILPFYNEDFNKPDFLYSSPVNKLNFLKDLEFDVIEYLTKREESVAALIIKGHSAAEIAEILHLSKRTVESYIIAIKNKLNCYSKNELVQRCLELDSIHFFS